MTVHLRHLAFVAWVIVLGAGLLACPPAIADTGAADPYVDQLAAAADTPTLGWADCDDGFLCATAEVPLNYNRPGDGQIELAVIKLPATDPQNRIGTLFINFGGPGQSGVDRLRGRARWPWLFSEELRSRFDLVSWDQRGVSRSAAVRCFPDAAEQWQFLVPSPGLPMDARGEQALFAWAKEFSDRCEQQANVLVDVPGRLVRRRAVPEQVGSDHISVCEPALRHAAGSAAVPRDAVETHDAGIRRVTPRLDVERAAHGCSSRASSDSGTSSVRFSSLTRDQITIPSLSIRNVPRRGAPVSSSKTP